MEGLGGPRRQEVALRSGARKVEWDLVEEGSEKDEEVAGEWAGWRKYDVLFLCISLGPSYLSWCFISFGPPSH